MFNHLYGSASSKSVVYIAEGGTVLLCDLAGPTGYDAKPLGELPQRTSAAVPEVAEPPSAALLAPESPSGGPSLVVASDGLGGLTLWREGATSSTGLLLRMAS